MQYLDLIGSWLFGSILLLFMINLKENVYRDNKRKLIIHSFAVITSFAFSFFIRYDIPIKSRLIKWLGIILLVYIVHIVLITYIKYRKPSNYLFKIPQTT